MSKVKDNDETRYQRYLTDPDFHSLTSIGGLHLKRALNTNVISQMVLDVALYGKAYAEIIHTADGVELKPLDPRYIRERRKGHKLLGYVQFINFPLATFKPKEIFAFKAGATI